MEGFACPNSEVILAIAKEIPATGNPVECLVRFYVCTVGGSRPASRRKCSLLPALVDMGCGPVGRELAPTAIQSLGNGKWLFVELWSSQLPANFVLRGTDRVNLPELEDSGVIQQLQLPDSAGLISSTYAVEFQDGVMGTIQSGGPYMMQLTRYLKSSGNARLHGLKIDPLVDTDVVSRVLDSKSLSYVDLQMYPSQLPLIPPGAGKVKGGLEYQLELWSEQKSLRFYIEPSNDSAGRAMEEYRNPITSIIQTWVPLAARGSKFKIKCSRLVEGMLRDVIVDVLSGKLTTEKTVELKGVRTSALDENSAFEAIREAYKDLQTDIQLSVAALLGKP